MSADTVCRVCLVKNLNLYSVPNDLQNVYERITREKYNKDGYPVNLCYICLSVLRKCHRFMETAEDTNTLLKHGYNCNQQDELAVAHPLTTYAVSKIQLVSIAKEDMTSEDIKPEIDLVEQLADLKTDDSQINQDITEVKPEIGNDVTLLSTNLKDLKIKRIQQTEAVIVSDNINTENSNSKPVTLNPKNVKCDKCNKVCSSAISLRRHYITMHITNVLYKKKNNMCNKECRLQCIKNRILHIHSETDSDKHICGNQSTVREFTDQSTRFKSNKKAFEVPLRTRSKLSCNKCGYKGMLPSQLIAHKKTHSSGYQFSCNVCNYIFTKKSHLEQHSKIHTVETPFKLPLPIKEYLNKQKKIRINEKPFSCLVCGNKFSAKEALKLHMRTEHTGEKPYSCNICDYRCSTKSKLRDHQKLHSK